MEPDLAQLRALAATVDTGSFEAAASALHLTPSAVSQRIKALETSVGQVLVRRTKPTATTDAGERYLRLARQIDSLVRSAAQLSPTDASETFVTVPLAVNSDSLATWVLPALAGIPVSIAFDLHREDQDHSADLLRAGTVMAAITTDSRAVQGCTVERLGTMRYRALASPDFVARWFQHGVTKDALAHAPLVVFDRKDDLQDRYLRSRGTRGIAPPRHHVPGSADFSEAVRLGLGWGMVPDQQSASGLGDGTLVDFDPDRHIDVTLHWQQWTLRTPALDAIADAIRTAAAEHLSR
ncbi:MAG TPA: LysR family transcriptional regulator ArgP [Galbitalea sp.]